MRSILCSLLCFLAFLSPAQSQTINFTPYGCESEVKVLLTAQDALFCVFDCGVLDGVGDCIRMSVKTQEDLKAKKNSSVISELGSDSFESTLIKKQRSGDSIEFFYKVSDEFIDAWRESQIMIITGLQPLTSIAREVNLTGNDQWESPLPWNLEENGHFNQMSYREYMQTIYDRISDNLFEGTPFEKYDVRLPMWDSSLEWRTGTGIDEKYHKVHSGTVDQMEGMEIFYTRLKEYGYGLCLCLYLPEGFNIDSTVQYCMTLEMENEDEKVLLLPIMTNTSGAAIFTSERRDAYRFGYVENGDTISSKYSSYYTSKVEFRERFDKARASGELFDSVHPDKTYWKETIPNLSAFKDSIETNYFYLCHEDDMFDSCFMHNEVTLYLDLTEDDLALLQRAKSVTRWVLSSGPNQRIEYNIDQTE